MRPYQAAHLCFEVDGILEISNAQLGAAATAFDFPAFYAILGAMPTVNGDASRLEYDFPAIDAAVLLLRARRAAEGADARRR